MSSAEEKLGKVEILARDIRSAMQSERLRNGKVRSENGELSALLLEACILLDDYVVHHDTAGVEFMNRPEIKKLLRR